MGEIISWLNFGRWVSTAKVVDIILILPEILRLIALPCVDRIVGKIFGVEIFSDAYNDLRKLNARNTSKT